MSAEFDGATDAVILVDDAGTVTLYLGDSSTPRLEAGTNTAAIRILLDHATAEGRSLTVITRYPSGHHNVHVFEPDGAVSALPEGGEQEQSRRGAFPIRATSAAALAILPATPSSSASASSASSSAEAPVSASASTPETGSSHSPTTSVGQSRARPFRAAATAALLIAMLGLTQSGSPPLPVDGGSDLDLAGPGRPGVSPPHLQPEPTQTPSPSPSRTESPEPTSSPTPDDDDEEQDEDADDASDDDTHTDDPDDTEPPGDDNQPTPPSRPSGLAVAERTGTSVTVSWSPSSAELGVSGYAVYLDGTRTDTVSGTRATVGGLRPATSYAIAVAAVDTGGAMSARASLTATTLDTVPPSAPGNVSITDRTGTSLSVSWGAASDNVGVTAYTVYLDGSRVTTVTGTSATVGNLTPATPYRISVAAVDGAGNASEQSSVRGETRDTIPPTRPPNLSGQARSMEVVDLDWDASSDNVGVTGYAVYVNGSRVTTVTGTSARVDGLKPGTAYTLSVAALDAAGNTSERASVEVRTRPRI